MKKVLFLIEELGGGGAEKVLVSLVNPLCDNYEITVQTLYNQGLYRDALDKRIKYETVVRNPTKNKKRIINRMSRFLPAKWLHKRFIKGEYDVEVGFLEGIPARIISGASSDVKTIAWIHNDIENLTVRESGFPNLKDENKSYNTFDKIACVSKDAKRAFKSKNTTKVEPVVIYNPIDKKDILASAKAETTLTKPKEFTFCAVARLFHSKGFDRLINAAKRLTDEKYNFCVWIIGEGPLRQELQEQIDKSGLQGKINLVGFFPNPYAVMNLCDAYVCSSRIEGYSLAVAEALVIGMPVISTKCTGPVELLAGGEFGSLVENSEQGIYEGMKEFLDNPKRVTELKEKAIERREFFSLENTVNEVIDLIEK